MMRLTLAILWLVFWIGGIGFALVYANFEIDLTSDNGKIVRRIGDAEQAMICIMLHTVLCMPTIASFLEKALLSGGEDRPNLKPAFYRVVFGLHLAILLMIASFIAKPFYLPFDASEDALDLFVNATAYGGFLSATVLLLVGTQISAAERAALRKESSNVDDPKP